MATSESRCVLVFIDEFGWSGKREDFPSYGMVALRVVRVLFDSLNLVTLDVLHQLVYVPEGELLYPSLLD